jgi:hypothetical protein
MAARLWECGFDVLDCLGSFLGRTASNVDLAVLLVENLYQLKSNSCITPSDDEYLE